MTSVRSNKLPCPNCDQMFGRQDNLARHLKLAHSGKNAMIYMCGVCPLHFKTRASVKLHRQLVHVTANRGGQNQFRRVRSAHGNACEEYRLEIPHNIRLIMDSFAYALTHVRQKILQLLAEKRNLKASLTLNVRFVKADPRADQDEDALGFEGVDVLTVPMRASTQMFKHMEGTEREQIAQMFDQINHTVDSFTHNGSGWVVGDVLNFVLQVNECHSLAGACALHSVKYVRGRGMIVEDEVGENKDGVKNKVDFDGERCFYRAVARGILHNRGVTEPSMQMIEEFIHANICENVPTPVEVKNIGAFEAANSHLNVAVNVLYMDEQYRSSMYPVRASPNLRPENQIQLMLFHTESEEKKPILHYAWIENITTIVGERKVTQSGNTYKHNKFVCFNCFMQFHEVEALENHAEWCHTKQGQKVVVPEEGEAIRYEQYHRELLMPWCFAFDFETLQLTPSNGACSCAANKIDKCKHKTKIITEQQPFAYSLVMTDRYGKICEDLTYMGADAADHFLETIMALEVKYAKYLRDNYKPLVMTEKDEEVFAASTKCYMCAKPLVNDKVKDHDHLTGNYKTES